MVDSDTLDVGSSSAASPADARVCRGPTAAARPPHWICGFATPPHRCSAALPPGVETVTRPALGVVVRSRNHALTVGSTRGWNC